jgi:hypothetical protein
MAMKARDREFRIPKVSYIDYKHIEMDRTLLNLCPRLRWNGYTGRARPAAMAVTLDKLVDEYCDEKNLDRFRGFAERRDVVRKWLETDLLDVIRRGRPDQAVVSPRPLHGETYKFRNSKHARDYGSAEQVYWMLAHARGTLGTGVVTALRQYLFPGLDPVTDSVSTSDAHIDVETEAILHLGSQIKDSKDTKEPERHPPLCRGAADIMADDILRLLTYEHCMPRTVLLDYLKTLLAFHLALYHLRLMKLLPALVRAERGEPVCGEQGCPVDPRAADPQRGCRHRAAVVVDMGLTGNTHMEWLARRSADTHYQRIPEFIRATFIARKLDEMAEYMRTIKQIPAPADGRSSLGDALQLLQKKHETARETYFQSRMAGLIEDVGSDNLPPEAQRVLDQRLPNFDAYIEMLVALRGGFHRGYIVKCLDSLLLKNDEAGLLVQPRARLARRRFVMGSRLLEALLQVAVVAQDSKRQFYTRQLRVDELLEHLRQRYGLYVDRLPAGGGLGVESILDRQALRSNVEAFKSRLRDIGFFQDLSDAYVTQTVLPRYTIGG